MSDSIEEQIADIFNAIDSYLSKSIAADELRSRLRSALTAVRETTLKEVEEAGPKPLSIKDGEKDGFGLWKTEAYNLAVSRLIEAIQKVRGK